MGQYSFTTTNQIFIDYGMNWESSWISHVNSWKAPPSSKDGKILYSPVSTFIANKDIRTIEEIKTNPYPENVQLLCYKGRYKKSKTQDLNEEKEDIEITDAQRAFHAYNDILDEPDNLVPCEVIEQSNSGETFIVRLLQIENNRNILVRNYPRMSIVITMKPYTSDQHLGKSFRHFIEISDDIFPDKWKNE